MASGKFKNTVALITGGDSGIGRAVSLAFAKEGADISIVYLYEHEDAREKKAFIEAQGRKCLLLPSDLREESFCKQIVRDTISTFGLYTPMKRAGQPVELGLTYVYLAFDDSTYVTGQILHVDGGSFIGS